MEAGKRKSRDASPPIAPPEILSLIFGRLDARSLASARLVCREWRALATPLVRAARLRDGFLEILDEPYAGEHHALCIAAWGDLLASGSADGLVRLWNRKGECARVLSGHEGAVQHLATRGDLLASAAIAGPHDIVRLWNRESECVLRFREIPMYCMAAWGELLAFGSIGGTVRLCDREGECVRTLRGHKGSVNSLATWSEMLASGSVDGTVRLWNREGGCERVLDSCGGGVCSLIAWGEMLACGSAGGALRLWNRDGECARVLRKGGETSYCLGMWGELLVSGTADGIVRLWNREGECARVLRVRGGSGNAFDLVAWGEMLVFKAHTERDEALVFWGVPEIDSA